MRICTGRGKGRREKDGDWRSVALQEHCRTLTAENITDINTELQERLIVDVQQWKSHCVGLLLYGLGNGFRFRFGVVMRYWLTQGVPSRLLDGRRAAAQVLGEPYTLRAAAPP